MTNSIQEVAIELTIVTLTMNPALSITTSTGVMVPTEKMPCSAASTAPCTRADVERLFEMVPAPVELLP